MVLKKEVFKVRNLTFIMLEKPHKGILLTVWSWPVKCKHICQRTGGLTELTHHSFSNTVLAPVNVCWLYPRVHP